MSKPIRPIRTWNETADSYPTLRSEWDRRGATRRGATRRGTTRRGFLWAALAGAAGAAGAMTGCMGAAPRPSYPTRRWGTLTIRFDRTVAFSGCGDAVERQGFVAVQVSTRIADLLARLRPEAAQTSLRHRTQKILASAVCRHSTLASFRARVEQVLRQEVIAWYRTSSGVTLQTNALRVTLQTAAATPPPPRRAIATD
jgi:hypothetical protein